MKIIVTGGAGFIGSHLVDRLVEDHEVTVIDDLSGGFLENINPKARYLNVDCRNDKAMDGAMFMIKPEIVYHLAANAAENKAQFSPIDITSRNYAAFINTLTPFIKCGGKRFVFTSSIAVYGALQTPFKETDKPEPEDLYGITKLAAEQTLRVMSKVHNFEYVIARPHNVYGPRQNMKDPYRNVVTIWMNALLKEEPFYIYGNGNQVRQFSYINGVIEQLLGCGFENVSGMVFNIGNDEKWTLNMLAKTVGQIAGNAKHPSYLPLRPQEVVEAISDHSLAKKHVGYSYGSTIDAISRTWQWCVSQGPQEVIKTELELMNDKVPKNWL